MKRTPYRSPSRRRNSQGECPWKRVEKEKEDAGWLKGGDVAVGPVSEVEQFILVSTECHGYRGPDFTTARDHKPGTPSPLLADAVLPDYFEIDHVRVFDRI